MRYPRFLNLPSLSVIVRNLRTWISVQDSQVLQNDAVHGKHFSYLCYYTYTEASHCPMSYDQMQNYSYWLIGFQLFLWSKLIKIQLMDDWIHSGLANNIETEKEKLSMITTSNFCLHLEFDVKNLPVSLKNFVSLLVKWAATIFTLPGVKSAGSAASFHSTRKA